MSIALLLLLVHGQELALDDECQGDCALMGLQLKANSLDVNSFGDPTDELLWAKYQDFLLHFAREYGAEEQKRRFENFKRSFFHVRSKFEGPSAFGISSFADFYPEELPRRGLQTDLPEQVDLGSVRLATEHLAEHPEPRNLNWRLTRAVSPVKNQGACGAAWQVMCFEVFWDQCCMTMWSQHKLKRLLCPCHEACWAFVTAQEMESMYTLWQAGGDSGYTQLFSVQQMISCSPQADGCGGGNPVDGYNYIMQNDVGLVQENFWPYEGGYLPDDRCDFQSCTKPCNRNLTDARTYQHVIGPIGRVLGALWATPMCPPGTACENQNLETLRRSLVQLGPVAIAVNSEHWVLYAGGVVSYEHCGGSGWQDLDHAAQLTGYNTTAPESYWIVRNSWSTTWGENGYIHLEFGKNTCGLANLATLPLLDGMPDPEELEDVVMLETRSSSSSTYSRLYQEALG